MIMQEMLCDTNKHFNNDNNFHANQQLIGCEDLFRRVAVKEWAMVNQKGLIFICEIKR